MLGLTPPHKVSRNSLLSPRQGYDEFNVGLESGLDDVLAWMGKGYDVAEARRQLLRLREAGINFSVNIINAAAGPARIVEAAAANAAIVNDVRPYLVFVSPLHVNSGSRLERDVLEGEFEECDLGSYVDEEIAFLEALDVDGCVFYGVHVSNPVPVSGILPRDKARMLKVLRAGRDRFPEEILRSHPSKGSEGRLL